MYELITLFFVVLHFKFNFYIKVKNVRNFASGSASRTGRDVGQVGQVRQVRLRELWGERIGEQRVNDIYFL